MKSLPVNVMVVVSVLIWSLSACGAAPAKNQTKSPAVMGEGGIPVYLETLHRLTTSDPAQQADVFYEVERAYTSAPTTANTLRYAIALVAPSHPASNLAEGKKLLEQLLATPERLVQAERHLAGYLVKDADSRLQLQADVRRLTATVDERGRAQLVSDKRVQTQTDEIARLRRALQEAQQKLDAIKSIENSSERNAPSAGRESSPRIP